MSAICGGVGDGCYYRKNGVAHVHCAICRTPVLLQAQETIRQPNYHQGH